MAKRKRDMQLNFRVSAEELAVIEQKMSQFGTSNREAYLRKMALVCSQAGAAGVEGACFPDAPKQQQLKPADP